MEVQHFYALKLFILGLGLGFPILHLCYYLKNSMSAVAGSLI